MPRARVIVHCGDGKFKAQMKKADASGARVAVILGEDEIASGTVGIKKLREGGEQEQVKQQELAEYCHRYLGQESKIG